VDLTPQPSCIKCSFPLPLCINLITTYVKTLWAYKTSFLQSVQYRRYFYSHILWQRITSHHITSHHITSHHITSHHIAVLNRSPSPPRPPCLPKPTSTSILHFLVIYLLLSFPASVLRSFSKTTRASLTHFSSQAKRWDFSYSTLRAARKEESS
jgi:hypothetical protein